MIITASTKGWPSCSTPCLKSRPSFCASTCLPTAHKLACTVPETLPPVLLSLPCAGSCSGPVALHLPCAAAVLCPAQPTNCPALQRAMLDKLALILASVLGAHVPVGAVALQATALLLEVLGEIPSDAAGTTREPLLGKLAAAQLCLRTQVRGWPQSRLPVGLAQQEGHLLGNLSPDCILFR